MEYRIELIGNKKLVGKHMKMSFAGNKTHELWSSFMPVRQEIKNITGPDLWSVQIYPRSFFDDFDPNSEFEKWAAIEVTDFKTVPAGMESFILTGGLYAVFLYKGAASAAAETFRYILGTWLPEHGYELALRPHFEILGEKYKRNSPDSEEEIWIPVKKNVILRELILHP